MFGTDFETQAELKSLEKSGVIRIKTEHHKYSCGEWTETKFIWRCPTCDCERIYTDGTYVVRNIKDRMDCCKCRPPRPKEPKDYKELPRNSQIPIDFPVNKRKGVADIYCRVSCQRQALGHGLQRQEESGIEFCKKNKIQVRHIIQDICSAYNKDNCVTGNIGSKLIAWETKVEQAPNFLILENMDRFSRQHPFIAMGHIKRVLDLNIKFVISNGLQEDIILDRKRLGKNSLDLL